MAASAIGGGLAILSGLDKFPQSWLSHTPFSDYTIPALVLLFIVGGSSLVATLAIFLKKSPSQLESVIAGSVMICWIALEVDMINAPKPSFTEVLYFVLGAIVLGLSEYSRLRAPVVEESSKILRTS